VIGRLALLFALALPPAHAAPQPYDEKADAKADVQRALSDAKSSGMPVLVIFGANWCQERRARRARVQGGEGGRRQLRP
jgi:thioredoxin